MAWKKKQARDKRRGYQRTSDFMTRDAKKESATCRNCTSEAHMFHIGRSIWVWNSNLMPMVDDDDVGSTTGMLKNQ